MAQLQAQIVSHGEVHREAMLIEDADSVYAQMFEMGAWPLNALIEARAYADEQTINEVMGKPVASPDEYEPVYRPDPTRPEIWVDPKEFIQVGVACVYHRHILVTPVIDVSEMPPLTLVVNNGD